MKKVLCLVLALMMAISVLTGCAGQPTSGSGDITLKWYVPGDKQQDIAEVMEAANKITMDKIGVKLDLQFIDQGAFQQRMNMNMASSDKYDLAFVGYLNKFVDAARNGGLMQLDDLLKTTPELVKSLPDYVWEQGKIDGKMYAVPNYQMMISCTSLAINKNLAEKYNLNVDSIKKTTDIEPFLQKIRDNEPGIYPFRANWGIASFRSLDEKIHSSGEALYIDKKDESGKYVAVDGQEYGEAFEKAKLLHEWYKKGFLRKDIESVMDDTTDVKAGKYAVFCTSYKPGVEAELESQYGYPMKIVKVGPIIRGNSRATMIGIGKNSEHPKEAIKMIELLNTNKELYNLIAFGIEGKHYKKVGENRIELIPNSGYNPNAAWKFGNQFNAYLLPGQADDVWEETKKLNDESLPVTLPGFEFDTSNVKTIVTKVTAVKDEYAVIRKGTEDPVNYWDAYKKKLYDSGLQTIIDEYQKQLEEFQKNNN